MEYLKNWNKFTEVSKPIVEKYTKSDIKKDYKRIEDMKKKAKDEDELIKLATTMANRITTGEKAYNRGMAAKEMGEDAISKIFLDKAKELKFVNEKKKEDFEFVNIEPMNKAGFINVIFYDENDKHKKRKRFDDMKNAVDAAKKWEKEMKKK